MAQIVAFLLSVLFINAAQADDRFITLSSTTRPRTPGCSVTSFHSFGLPADWTFTWWRSGPGRLALGMRGDADVLLVHDRAGEDKFVPRAMAWTAAT